MLILIGGADDVRTQEKLCEILKVNNVKNILIIPAATKYQLETFEKYSDFFKKCHCTVKNWFCADSNCSDLLYKSDFIFITGGNQQKLIDKLKNTSFSTIIKKRLEERDNLIIAGTSAGAMSLSKNVIIDNERIDGFDIVNYTIDTHFTERNRLFRLIHFMCNEKIDEAIGIDEDTLVIDKDEQFEVFGKGFVYFIKNDFTANNFSIKILKDGDVLKKI